MGMHLPFGVHRPGGRLLMEAHRIGARRVEPPVVAPGQLRERLAEPGHLAFAHLIDTADAPTRQDQPLERPPRTESLETAEIVVGEDDAFAHAKLLSKIPEKERTSVPDDIFAL